MCSEMGQVVQRCHLEHSINLRDMQISSLWVLPTSESHYLQLFRWVPWCPTWIICPLESICCCGLSHYTLLDSGMDIILKNYHLRHQRTLKKSEMWTVTLLSDTGNQTKSSVVLDLNTLKISTYLETNMRTFLTDSKSKPNCWSIIQSGVWYVDKSEACLNCAFTWCKLPRYLDLYKTSLLCIRTLHATKRNRFSNMNLFKTDGQKQNRFNILGFEAN